MLIHIRSDGSKITLPNKESYALDFTAPQYGWYGPAGSRSFASDQRNWSDGPTYGKKSSKEMQDNRQRSMSPHKLTWSTLDRASVGTKVYQQSIVLLGEDIERIREMGFSHGKERSLISHIISKTKVPAARFTALQRSMSDANGSPPLLTAREHLQRARDLCKEYQGQTACFQKSKTSRKRSGTRLSTRSSPTTRKLPSMQQWHRISAGLDIGIIVRMDMRVDTEDSDIGPNADPEGKAVYLPSLFQPSHFQSVLL
ncbi:MAG: hypothetical protein Q9169_005525 [Polycauliona sp. 2 TL-2023]